MTGHTEGAGTLDTQCKHGWRYPITGLSGEVLAQLRLSWCSA